MTVRTCAYCGSNGNLTREHLWPASLHARLMAATSAPNNAFWLRRIGAEIEGEPKIRDVCRVCNNGPLSELDNYICSLFDRYFVRILRRHEAVQFQYDYHRLARWLLKMSFNSARMHSSVDLIAYPPLLDYISGRSTEGSRSVQVFLQLSYPGPIPAARLAAPELQGSPALWEPQDNRVGLLHFEASGIGRKLLRAVHLRSYSFFLTFFKPGEKRSVTADFAEIFISGMPKTVLLMPSRPAITLICDGVDAWRSYDGARENQIVAQ